MEGFNMRIPVENIHPHPGNPRKDLGDISELVQSVKANGIFQPLSVIPILAEDGDIGTDFTVIMGHRRLAAAKEAGLSWVPCVVITSELSEKEQLSLMLQENMQRNNLTVYEEAVGFQQLLDFGADIDEICEKSGFSEATVRRRLEIAKLDREKVKQASSRQPSLGDFAKLAKIEDIEARNALLDDIGTNNFDYKVNKAIQEQKLKKLMEPIDKVLAERGIKEVPVHKRYNGECEICFRCQLADWEKKKDKFPEDNGLKCYYDYNYNEFCLYRELPKKPKPTVSEEDIKKARAVELKWAKLDKIAEDCYKLRSAFIAHLSMSKKNALTILKGALIAGTYNELNYFAINKHAKANMAKLMGIHGEDYTDEYRKKSDDVNTYNYEQMEREAPRLVYMLFNDSVEKRCCEGNYRKAMPKYQPDAQLQLLYCWLSDLGYDMSDTEIQLLYGTHPIFQCELDFGEE